MKALITGITGMVGSHLADFLLDNTDWDVYGVCRWRSPLDNVAHLLERVNNKDRIFFEYADLNDEMSLITAVNKIKPDYVFHLAAQSYPQTSFTAPIDTLNTNILGTCRLLEAFHLAIRFIDDSEIKYYFNAADILALPYLQIYQSGVVLLGYAYEKPIVATTEGEFLTVVKDKETGLLVPAGNSEELAKALNWYLDNPEQAKQFAKAGKEDISVRLSWDTISQNLKQTYLDVLK